MLEKLISDAKKFIFNVDLLPLKLQGDYKYYNEEYFDLYMMEIDNDIRCLNFLLDLPEFERENNGLFPILTEKYKSDYCKSTFYEYFSDENKLYYCYKRVEIDEILSEIIRKI